MAEFDGFYWLGTTEEGDQVDGPASARYARCVCGHSWAVHKGNNRCSLCRKCKGYKPKVK